MPDWLDKLIDERPIIALFLFAVAIFIVSAFVNVAWRLLVFKLFDWCDCF